MLCLKCGIREATRGNYCDIDRPSAGDMKKFIDGALSLSELRERLFSIEATESLRLISLSAVVYEAPDQSTLVTSASFEPLSPEDLPSTSELELIEAGSEVDASSMIVMQRSKGYQLVTRSSAYVGGKLTNILVFRRA